MGKYYTIPNHNSRFTNSFKERPANELQDAVRFFSLIDGQDLLDTFQARAVYVFSPLLRDVINRELERRKHFKEQKDKVLVVPVPNIPLNMLEKIVQLTHAGFTDITKQSFTAAEFEHALVSLQIDYLTDDNSRRASNTGVTVKEHVNHTLQMHQQPSMSMISADDYYPANYFSVVQQQTSSRGKGRGRKSAPVVMDSDSNSSDYLPQKKKPRAVKAAASGRPNTEKTIWKCGFDCPGVFFYSLKDQTAHHADVHKVDFGEDRPSRKR